MSRGATGETGNFPAHHCGNRGGPRNAARFGGDTATHVESVRHLALCKLHRFSPDSESVVRTRAGIGPSGICFCCMKVWSQQPLSAKALKQCSTQLCYFFQVVGSCVSAFVGVGVLDACGQVAFEATTQVPLNLGLMLRVAQVSNSLVGAACRNLVAKRRPPPLCALGGGPAQKNPAVPDRRMGNAAHRTKRVVRALVRPASAPGNRPMRPQPWEATGSELLTQHAGEHFRNSGKTVGGQMGLGKRGATERCRFKCGVCRLDVA